MPAALAACTPGTESSTTMLSNGCSFIAIAACRKRSGNGLPRGTWLELKMRPSKRASRPVTPSDTSILSKPPELATQVATPAASSASIASWMPGTGCRGASRNACSVSACSVCTKSSGRVRASTPSMISTHDFSDRPSRRRIVSSTDQSSPSRFSAREKTVLESGSLSTSTPSQSKMTSTSVLVSERLVSGDSDAVAAAGVGPVVPHRTVLDAAIVPEGDRVRLPAEAALEQRVFHVLVEVVQDAVALVARHADQVAGEAAIHIERLLARHRMSAHHRMDRARILLLLGDAEILVEAAIDRCAVMERRQAVEIGLHAVRQRLVGGVHVGEQRIAALGRTGLDVEDGAHRRFLVAAHVGVPALAIGARAVLVGVDDHQLRPAFFVRCGGMDVQVTEQPAERHVLVERDVLVAEEDDAVLGERAVHLVLLAVGEWLRQVDAAQLRANHRRQLVDGDGLIGRALVGDVTDARALLAALGSLHG